MMSRKRMMRTALLPVLLVGFLGVCGLGPTELSIDDADVRVLFVGNSLTYTNDVPAMVATIAERRGHSFEYATVARPNYSLEDHWHAGVGPTIESVAADVVVFQQGPSSLPANQAYLAEWAQRLAPVVRAVGGEPAFYMVWPDESRRPAFEDVARAYAGAADSTGGLFIPAGSAWVEAWNSDPALEFYGPDRFHPSELGSAVAALTIYSVLFDEPVSGLPDRIEPTSGELPVIRLGDGAETILAAVDRAVAAARAPRPD